MTSKPAVILVDVQQDYLSRAGLIPDRELFESALRDFLDAARRLGWFVIHVQTRVSRDGHDAMPHLRDSGRFLCAEGTAGILPPASLAPLPGEAVFHKRFYSGFEDPRLLQHLKEMQIDTLVAAGLYTHACVRSTVLDAYREGLRVFVAADCVASYDRSQAELALEWMQGRAAQCLPSHDILARLSGRPPEVKSTASPTWLHRNPMDWSEVLDEVRLCRENDVASASKAIARRQPLWCAVPSRERAERIAAWAKRLAQDRARWVGMLIRDVGKPRVDAEGEVRYGLALLESVCAQFLADEQAGKSHVRYRPHGLVGLITPWNNPFAIPIGKIAPALGYGNGVLWKPALPASALSTSIKESLADAGLGDLVALLTGDSLTGTLVVRAPDVSAISFTGSIPVGRQLTRLCASLSRPFQGELGGNNAAVVLAGIDVAEVARDLAQAMFSFAGQRCTAIRRVIVQRDILEPFSTALRAEVEALIVGSPADSQTQVGPVIGKPRQDALLALVGQERAAGARIVAEAKLPEGFAGACFVAPTVMTGLAADSAVVREELFGPVVALMPARDLDEAIGLHNSGEQGLLGAFFSRDANHASRFLAEAQAGILSINQARPRFAGSGPFVGWKASGVGVPEHGRWNRDFYTRTQAVYWGG